jgi:hypothetical protein
LVNIGGRRAKERAEGTKKPGETLLPAIFASEFNGPLRKKRERRLETEILCLQEIVDAPDGPAHLRPGRRDREPGKLADFDVLSSDPALRSSPQIQPSDPAEDAKAFADVQVTVRSGKVIWRAAIDSLAAR